MTTARTIHLSPIQLASDGKGAPEWAQLTPQGPELSARDGRQFKLSNPQTVLDSFAALERDLAIDFEHASEERAPFGLDAPAVGWINEMEIREGAIWGKVAWTEQGEQLVSTRAYRFLSPAFFVDASTNEMVSITSAGLTNAPAFKMAELARAGETQENQPMDKAIADALGLSTSATAAEAVAKIGEMKLEMHTASSKAPDPEKYVPKAQLDAANAKIKEQQEAQTAREDAVLTKLVDQATEDGKIAPGVKDHYLDTARAVGEEKFTAMVEAMPSIVGGKSQLDGKDPAAPGEGKISAEQKEVARQMGQDPDEMFGTAKKKEA